MVSRNTVVNVISHREEIRVLMFRALAFRQSESREAVLLTFARLNNSYCFAAYNLFPSGFWVASLRPRLGAECAAPGT